LDYLLGFGAHSGFGFCDTIFGVWGSGFSFFDTILGFGVLVVFTPHQGSGFWFFHTKLGFGVLVKK
jgi:hypothetical protein